MDILDTIAMYYGYAFALITWPQLILIFVALAAMSAKWLVVWVWRTAVREYRSIKREVSGDE
jgi:hypothetical protein